MHVVIVQNEMPFTILWTTGPLLKPGEELPFSQELGL